jgi:hypothetical protein
MTNQRTGRREVSGRRTPQPNRMVRGGMCRRKSANVCLHAEPLEGFELELRMRIHTVDQCNRLYQKSPPSAVVASTFIVPATTAKAALANGERISSRCPAHCLALNAGSHAWFARVKIKTGFLTNRRTHIGQWFLPQAQSTAFDGLHHSDWFCGGILHYRLVLSAAKEMLGNGFGWGSVVEDVYNAGRRCWPMGRIRFFEKRFRHHHRERCESRPAHGHSVLQAPGPPGVNRPEREDPWTPARALSSCSAQDR